MSSKRYTEEFKQEAVKQLTDRGHKHADVARLGDDSVSSDRDRGGESPGFWRVIAIAIQRSKRTSRESREVSM